MCLGHYRVGLVCVSKVTNMTCNLLWTRQKVTDCILPQEPSYSLLSPNISQVATCLPQKLSYSLKIFKTGAKLQHAFSLRYRIQVTAWTKVQPAFIRHEPRDSLHSPDRNQGTVHIFQWVPKLQCTSTWLKPSHSLCIMQHVITPPVCAALETYCLSQTEPHHYKTLQTLASKYQRVNLDQARSSVTDTSQNTACAKRNIIQPAFSRHEPIY